VLDTLTTARQETGAAMVLITHDLGVVAGQADRVLVMYAGKPVEIGTVDEIFYTPRMPYTLGLLGSLPRLDATETERLTPIVGSPPSLINLLPGCPFAPRCPLRQPICDVEEPELRPTTSPTHVAACHFSDQLEGKAPADLFQATSTDDVLPEEAEPSELQARDVRGEAAAERSAGGGQQ
jgi:peptide/nickel transport system ATP-binding protein